MVRVLARWSRQLHNSILVGYQIGQPNIGIKTGFAPATELVSDVYGIKQMEITDLQIFPASNKGSSSVE